MGRVNNDEHCCGSCCWFKFEDLSGLGNCVMDRKVNACGFTSCDMEPCADYVCIEQMRHYRAVLLQLNRYRRDQHVPSIYRMPDVTEIGKAIDFASECMRVFSEM